MSLRRLRRSLAAVASLGLLATLAPPASGFPGPTVSADTVVTLVAGQIAAAGFSGDGGPATAAEMSFVLDVVTDDDGNIFVVDAGNTRVRRIDAASGVITTIAGNGGTTTTGDGGPASAAGLANPVSVAYHDGSLAIGTSDTIRRVDLSTGVISTIAGSAGTPGTTGDGGLATSATVTSAQALAYDDAGNLYFGTDSSLRRIDAATGIVTRVAGDHSATGFTGDGGPALAATFGSVFDVDFDSAGNIVISDNGNNRIRRIDIATGVVTTIVGDGTLGLPVDGEPSTGASIEPLWIAIDSKDNIYVSTGFDGVVLRHDAATGTIATVAGDPGSGVTADGTPAIDFDFGTPAGLALGPEGELIVTGGFVPAVFSFATPDTVAPVVTINAPAVVQRFGSSGTSYSFSCVDAVDPSPSCVPTFDDGSAPPQIPTDRIFPGSITVTSTDAAGNVGSATHNYTMDWKVYGTYEGASGNAGTVVRFYIATFGRLPDAEGFDFWVGRLANDPAAITDVAAFFTSSTEFQILYGTNVSNADFIETIYGNVLGRNPDGPGRAFWAARLDSGEMTRGQIMEFFAQSPEHKIITATR